MSWRRIVRQLPALTLVLLGLVLAAPLSSGDRGLWLSVAPSAVLLVTSPASGLPAEHSTVLPDWQVRPDWAGRTEHVGPYRSLAPVTPFAGLVQTDGRGVLPDIPWTARLQPIVALSGPRAPPA